VSILVNSATRVLVQGIAGNVGRFSARDMQAYGTRVVAGTAFGRSETNTEGVTIFSSVAAAVRETGANASLVYVPAVNAVDHVIEAFEAGIALAVYPGDGLPVLDAIEMRAAALANGCVLVGPNTPGVISPARCKMGFMPSSCYAEGALGVISRSGSLSYESCYRLTQARLGQTTVVGIGGDPIKGLTTREAVKQFHEDPQTRAIVYLGEIGGTEEYDLIDYVSLPDAKPLAALIVGRQAPPGRKMGHAAALVNSHAEGHAAKCEALKKAGIAVAESLSELVACAETALKVSATRNRQVAGAAL
jgi:succinyl-CoA synthetase alpha subunit